LIFNRLMINVVWITAFFLALQGCIVFEPEERKQKPKDMPDQYALYAEGETISDSWWRAFESPELNALVTEALSNNFDIRTAWARLKQADASARKAGAALLPEADYHAGAAQHWSESQISENGEKIRSNDQTWAMGLGASYEVDLWGRLRSLRRAEMISLDAERENLRTAAVSVAAGVMENWVDILAAREKIIILEEQIRMNELLLELQKFRFSNGKASALDVSQQKEALATTKAELPMLQLTERQLLHSIALLLGRTSAAGLEISRSKMPEPIPVPKTGLPADLLASRPDIRAAGLRLRSADWQVAAARADRLPSIVLSAQAAYSSGDLDLLFNNWINTLSASITGPLFDGGRRGAEVDRQRALAEERLANYAGTVSKAVLEVEDSLVGEYRQGEYIALLEDRLSAARFTLRNAQLQYQNGQSNYLSYLIAWTGVQGLERLLVGERANLIKYRIRLYRTLGGDWTGRLMDSAPSPKQQNDSGDQRQVDGD
jgi:multidrug efflux system outer membrane protein